MNPRPKEPRELEPGEEPDEDLSIIKQPQLRSQLIVGDIGISSSSSLDNCKKIMKDLLKDKQIQSYLTIHSKKKLLSIPTGVG